MSTDGIRNAATPAPPDSDADVKGLAAQVRSLRRWVVVLLVLLAFLVGGIGGGAAIWWRQAHQPGAAVSLARAVQVLGEPAELRAFRAALVDGRKAARPQVRDVQEARIALARLLAEPAASAEAVQAGLARLRQAEGALRESLEPRVAETVAGFSAERRRAIAEAIAPRGRRAEAQEE